MRALTNALWIVGLLAILCPSPALTEDVDYTITGRYRLAELAVEPEDAHAVAGVHTVLAAPEGHQLELVVLQVEAFWAEDERVKPVRARPELWAGEQKVMCVAERGPLGLYRRTNAIALYVRPTGRSRQATHTVEAVYAIPQGAQQLVLKIDDKTRRELPEAVADGAPANPLQVACEVLKSQVQERIERDTILNHRPKVTARQQWTSGAGTFQVLQFKVVLSPDVPKSIRSVTFSPRHFALVLPDGSRQCPVGALTPWEISGSRYSMNVGRNNDDSWPDVTYDLVFVVSEAVAKPRVVYLPGLAAQR